MCVKLTFTKIQKKHQNGHDFGHGKK